jgi:hypothetical protein
LDTNRRGSNGTYQEYQGVKITHTRQLPPSHDVADAKLAQGKIHFKVKLTLSCLAAANQKTRLERKERTGNEEAEGRQGEARSAEYVRFVNRNA